MAKHQVIIGRTELVDIVGVSLGVAAKVDTGAYRSAIHATNIKLVDVDGVPTLKYSIFGHPNAVIKRDLQTTDFEMVNVRSSNGEMEKRYAVKLRVKVANKIFTTSFSLADRAANVFPILIGRTALQRRFMVDANCSYVKLEPLLKNFHVSLAEFGEEIE